MELYPALDLRGGKVVRLSQGDASRQTVYADDPVAQAESFLAAGARWLHVVDLDRAFGQGENTAAIGAIANCARGRARVQCGGGFRSMEAIAAALHAGVTRIVIGTAAITDPGLVAAALAAHGPGRVAVGIDARDGQVAVRGWTEVTAVPVLEAAERVHGLGVETIIYTDVARDGMLTGPDLAGCRRLIQLGVSVIASGGFADLGDVSAARHAGCVGAVLGRSLYDGRIELAQAIAASADTTPA